MSVVVGGEGGIATTHRLLLLQIFTLPKVSAKTKFKLTAHEGCRVRKVALVNFASAACEDYTENCLVCLTNLGDIHIFTVPSLRPQVHYDCIRKEDISGIASCVFTKHGQGELGGQEGAVDRLLYAIKCKVGTEASSMPEP